MPTAPLNNPMFSNRKIRLDTLVRLGWLAILGQSFAILLVWQGLEFPFNAPLCLALVALSALVNVFLQLRFRRSVRLPPFSSTCLLAYNTAQLGALLYLTGGLQNPFSLFLMVPAVVSAAMQHARYTIYLALLITLISALLIFFHEPMPWSGSSPPDLPVLYVVGVWISIGLTMAFLSIYTARIAREGHQLAQALSATELVLANEQHLTNLDGLATAAAHELGTPLSTIQLVSRELEREMSPDDPLYEDIALLRGQAERCREILGKLRSLSGDDHSSFMKMNLDALIDEILEPFDDLDVEIHRIFPQSLADQPVLWRNPGLLYGLGNLIENAVDFATTQVVVQASWTESTIVLTIADDGPGISEAIMSRLGDPYVTTRVTDLAEGIEDASNFPSGDLQAVGGNAGGMGLGFFIAKTLLERTGARVKFGNSGPTKVLGLPENLHKTGGAFIEISWSRGALEANQ